MCDWDGQFDETLGLPIQLKNRVSNPGTPWEVLMWVDSEAAARVSGAAETVDYFR